MKHFENKTVVITGGTSGIGKAAAEKFLSAGANVAVWDWAEPNPKSEISNPKFFKVNVANLAEVEYATSETIKHFKQIHVLINNAGITRDASLQKMTSEQWQQVLDVNLTGVFNCCKAISPLMIQNNYGRIINTSSIVGLYGNYGQANYAATKAGVIAFSKTLARELGKHNITVNAVAPGFIATDMIKTIPEKVIAMMTEKVPLKKLGTPKDVANLYAFLASDEAQFISGAVVSVDGGLTI
ncbi:MAG: beta-ketoacyl-ACP reductase [Chitinophagales bacterium]|nr:beta-ketoacyl-ACP reductase [Chitinophagales bacterium]